MKLTRRDFMASSGGLVVGLRWQLLPARRDPDFTPPGWWAELQDTTKPVVYVTQGTVDNGDLTRFLGPSLAALADLDVLAVATTGHRTADVPFPVPGNARVAPFLPHGDLLPHVDLMITNGGFGGVQHALAHGIPLIIGGDTEDKPEVAARIAWAGAGINLRTATPTPQQIRQAVEKVLTNQSYRQTALGLAAKIADTTPLPATENALATTISLEPRIFSI